MPKTVVLKSLSVLVIKVGFAKTPKMLAYILDTKKIFGEVMFTSSMDFADEYGFDHYDGAKDLWNNSC